jgi:hypothetical protein
MKINKRDREEAAQDFIDVYMLDKYNAAGNIEISANDLRKAYLLHLANILHYHGLLEYGN